MIHTIPDRTQANQLLAALPSEERQRLEADLEWVALPRDKQLYDTGSVVRHVYFPTSAIVSLVTSTEDGAATEVAVVGNEGVVGVCAFMGGGLALSGAVVECGGHGWRMSAAAITYHTQRSVAVMQPFLKYAQNLFTHLVQTSCCNRHHTLEQQLCRWLLLHVDRLQGNALNATQERIARMLGVRREGVTVAASSLQRDGLIHYSRGRITISDRPGLEHRCCECYSTIRRADARRAVVPRHQEAMALAC